ncbi:MAG: hypothetical protein V1754_00575, partial [Pseudomonadota bacterium]
MNIATPWIRFLIVGFVSVTLWTGCQGQAKDICQEAMEHFAACTGQSAAAVTTCDAHAAIAAEKIVQTSCQDLVGGLGKGDGWTEGDFWDQLLCAGFMSGVEEKELEQFCCYDSNCIGELVCIGWKCHQPLSEGDSCGRDGH